MNKDLRITILIVLAFVTLTPGHAVQLPEFSKIFAENKQSVVTLEIRKDPVTTNEESFRKSAETSEMKKFFNKYFDLDTVGRYRKITGSGVVFSENGKILTAAHLVRGAKKILVDVEGGGKYTATILGIDDGVDLAVLKVSKKQFNLPSFSDSGELLVGQWVMAIGAPFGLEKSASVGVISGLNRNILSGYPVGLIQTDVSANPGNSGGALFDVNGNIIGIMTHIFTRSDVSQGVSFAIPISHAREVGERLSRK